MCAHSVGVDVGQAQCLATTPLVLELNLINIPGTNAVAAP